jgi:hypothetical protein
VSRRGRGGRRKRATNARKVAQRRDAPASSVEVLAGDAYRLLAHYVRSADSLGDAAAAARSDLRQNVQEVARLASGQDLVKIISSVRVAMVMTGATTGIQPQAAALGPGWVTR